MDTKILMIKYGGFDSSDLTGSDFIDTSGDVYNNGSIGI